MKNIITMLLLVLITSCGARKVSKETLAIKKDSIVKTDIAVTTIENQNKKDSTNINTLVLTDEFIITPIDTAKPIFVNNVEYKNVVLKIKKTKANTLYTNNKTESNTKLKDSIVGIVAIKKETVNEDSKFIDKKESIVGNIIVYSLLLLFWIIVILFIRKTYKEYVA
jgi:hypothetical protein